MYTRKPRQVQPLLKSQTFQVRFRSQRRECKLTFQKRTFQKKNSVKNSDEILMTSPDGQFVDFFAVSSKFRQRNLSVTSQGANPIKLFDTAVIYGFCNKLVFFPDNPL
jgi:hypothetical protein